MKLSIAGETAALAAVLNFAVWFSAKSDIYFIVAVCLGIIAAIDFMKGGLLDAKIF